MLCEYGGWSVQTRGIRANPVRSAKGKYSQMALAGVHVAILSCACLQQEICELSRVLCFALAWAQSLGCPA